MPRFRAKKDAVVPDGVYQPGGIVLAGDCITVSGDEAVLLRADPDTWEDMDALAIAEAAAAAEEAAEKQVAPDVKKVIGSAPKVKGAEIADATSECSSCSDN